MRVLMSAFACAPAWGSEAYVGHNWVRQMARFHDVTVLTDGRNRRPIEAFDYGPRVRFEFVDGLLRSARVGARYRDWRGGEWLEYYLFLVRSYGVARRLLRREPFDLSHLVTYANFRAPFFLTLLARPSIVGPVGGGEEYPPGFARTGYERARWLSIRLARVDPLLRLTLGRATLVLASNRDTARAIPCRSEVKLMRVGMDLEPRASVTVRRDGGIFEILWVGLIIDRKALDLLLEALPGLRREIGPGFRVSVYGDGPERGRLEHLARTLGVDGHVEWRGWRPRSEVLAAYQRVDVFCFTSLRETTGLVVLEAMGAGLPVVCLAHSGQGEIVTDECGVRITPEGRAQVVRGLESGLARLARDPDLRVAMGEAGRKRAEHIYSWDACGREMAATYERVVARHA